MQSQYDFWFKVVEFLQQNWAVIEVSEDGSCEIVFMGDTGGVFDSLTYESHTLAVEGLKRNGFVRYADDAKAQEVIGPPEPPFEKAEHSNGPIYSSGRYWKG